ncbi:aldolase/citrate lyase family protein [Devosia sp. YIM 151766]|uniref:HpcH/HpaI aldolase family protein n=1 Tax=Devosia sp. YIM 151766 TaxID=3017325 RepID=UPI00255C6B63|nr:aldolase/citrate lyase family protein [Devosia sp. YIM 151766]WIY53906.1 aldolase/citrate lyase family protein [Devosia sp. YIM 151766]
MRFEKFPLVKKLEAGPVFGMTLYTGVPAAVEMLGNWGLDFAFIEAEHANLNVEGPDIERMILAAKYAGISPLVRVAGVIEYHIRKVLELGAEGVIVPQVRTAQEMQAIVDAAKFPPFGTRGGDGATRSANFNGPGLHWPTYTETSNTHTLVIPTAENTEFFDNIDEILAVEGIDIVNFGPLDYALSAGYAVDYPLETKELRDALKLLVDRCRPKGIKIMAPCIPIELDQARRIIDLGIDMLIVGVDMALVNTGARLAREQIVDRFR